MPGPMPVATSDPPPRKMKKLQLTEKELRQIELALEERSGAEDRRKDDKLTPEAIKERRVNPRGRRQSDKSPE